ncbi:MAG: type II toxin-antitoxin system HicB family antitoxin [Candidatus Gracilibacteria bacterium]
MKKILLSYNIILKEEPEGGYTAMVPSLPGCITYGKTIEEAKEMAEDAISLYIESLEENGENIPSDGEMFITTLQLNIPERKKTLYA